MQTITLPSAPCGNERPNCRVLAGGRLPAKALCQIHTAWCPDDHNPRPPWEARSILEQRSFRTGG